MARRCILPCLVRVCRVASRLPEAMSPEAVSRTSPSQADDKEAELRKEAREARLRAAELSDQARRLRALAQKGVNNVMEAEEEPKSL